nr:reverse transcriptase domain-containing protein [Tanacetum cinerariifolium]
TLPSNTVTNPKKDLKGITTRSGNAYQRPTISSSPPKVVERETEMNTASSLGSGTLPSNTVTNPKKDFKGITTRSGNAYQRPTIPTTSSSPPKVVERETEPVVAPVIEPVVAPVTLKAEMVEINKNLIKVLQINQQVKAVTPSRETCGGPHSYNDCPATVGQTQNIYDAGAYQGGFNQNQNRNKQNKNFQNQNKNQGNNHGIPQGNNQGRNQFFQGASHGQNPPPAYQAPGYQALVHKPPIPQPNKITNFRQRLDESLFEAWEHYKLSIDRCPNHNILLVTQIDTFYKGLTLRHRDTINAAVGGTFMKRRPEECYDL